MILLTGGAGYIGSHAAIEFIKVVTPLLCWIILVIVKWKQ